MTILTDHHYNRTKSSGESQGLGDPLATEKDIQHDIPSKRSSLSN